MNKNSEVKVRILERKIEGSCEHQLTPEQRAHMEPWLAALRSGRYVQGSEKLRIDTPNGPEYCCLGVACDVASRSGEVNINWHPDNREYVILDPGADPNEFASTVNGVAIVEADQGTLPAAMQEYLGLDAYGHVHVRCDSLWDYYHHTGFCLHGEDRSKFGARCEETVWIEATELNDSARWSFPQIADVFEATYLAP